MIHLYHMVCMVYHIAICHTYHAIHMSDQAFPEILDTCIDISHSMWPHMQLTYVQSEMQCSMTCSTVSKPSLHAGMNMMLLNGLPVDGAGLELYPLLDKIAAEVATLLSTLRHIV